MPPQKQPPPSLWEKLKGSRSKRRGPFYKSQAPEGRYAMQLRKIAREVGRIVDTYPAGDPQYLSRIQQQLSDYAKLITPWANETARRVIADIGYQDDRTWIKAAKSMGVEIRAELKTAPTGGILDAFLKEQVRLITSLPLEAGARVHRLTTEGMADSTRFAEIADQISQTGKVTASRATLIARTEVARTAAGLTQARAVHIGSEGYIWKTAGDSDVRPSHRKLNGRYFRWDDPPLTDPPDHHAHPGGIWNCRCYAEPIIPDIK